MRGKTLLISLVVAGLGVALLAVYKQRFETEARGGAPVSVVMIREDLVAGSALGDDVLGVMQLPERYVESRHIRATDAHQIIGLRSRVAVRAGQSLLWTDLETAEDGSRDLAGLVRAGVRAVTVAVDSASSFDGLLRPGDRVDVFHHAERMEGGATTVSLLQNVIILAVSGDLGRGSRSSCDAYGDAHVTLGVSPAQAQLLLHADAEGEIGLALRNPTDIEMDRELPAATDADLQDPEHLRELSGAAEGPLAVTRGRTRSGG